MIDTEDLHPGQEYFYQFGVDGIRSPAGQTKTLPVGHVDRLVLAVATCSNYSFGYFNAYEVAERITRISNADGPTDVEWRVATDGNFRNFVGRDTPVKVKVLSTATNTLYD